MEAKEPTALDRITYGLTQWVSETLVPGMAKIAKAIRRKENE